MKKILFLIFAIAPLSLFGVTGDFLGASVRTNSIVDLYFTFATTNGTYDFGLATNKFKDSRKEMGASPKATMSLLRKNFDSDGNAGTRTRNSVAIQYVRAVGDVAQTVRDEEIISGTILRTAVSFNDLIRSDDASISITLASGFLTVGGTPNNAGTVTATNNSVVPHFESVCNWAMPGLITITNNYVDLEMVGFHESARLGLPIQSVKFWCANSAGTTNTAITTVTDMVVDRNSEYMSRDDSGVINVPPLPLWRGRVDLSNLAAGTIYGHFKAIPWEGTSASIKDTSDGVKSWGSGYYAPLKLWYDPGGTNTWVAYVASGGGAGTIQRASVFTDVSNLTAFATINAALNSIQASNGGTTAGARVYLAAGNHTWTGASASLGSQQDIAWATIEPAPGVARSAVTLNAFSGTKHMGGATHIKNVTIDSTSNVSVVNSGATANYRLWLDGVRTASTCTDTRLFNMSGTTWVTGCYFEGITQGISAYTSDANVVALIRGNRLSRAATGTEVDCWTVIGNDLTPPAGGTYQVSMQHMITTGSLFPTNYIVYQNILKRQNVGTGSGVMYGPRYTYTNNSVAVNIKGMAWVQNLVEGRGWAANPNFSINWSSNTLDEPAEYTGIVWHCLGQKVNFFEQGAGDAFGYRWGFLVNNIFGDLNTKGGGSSSAYLVGYGPASGGVYSDKRNGNIPMAYGMHTSGNWNAQDHGDDAASWPPRLTVGVPGISRYDEEGNVQPPPYSVPWVNPQYTTNSSDATHVGGGDYHLRGIVLNTPSPLSMRTRQWVLKWDLDGNPRGARDMAGPYAGGPHNGHGNSGF